MKHLLFERGLKSIEDLLGVTERVIREQIKAFALEDKVLYREREYQRETKASISTDRPRESASRSNKERQRSSGLKIPVGTSLSNLPNIFENLKNLIEATREANGEKSDMDNIEDITTTGTRVVVLWEEGDSPYETSSAVAALQNGFRKRLKRAVKELAAAVTNFGCKNSALKPCNSG